MKIKEAWESYSKEVIENEKLEPDMIAFVRMTFVAAFISGTVYAQEELKVSLSQEAQLELVKELGEIMEGMK